MGEAVSWCRENTAIGADGVRTGNGLVSITNNAVWKREDFPTKPEVDRIRKNIHCLKDGFFSLPTWRDFAATVDFVDINQANAMEWDLDQIYLWLQTMANSFHFREAGTIFMEAGGVFNG